MFGIPKKYFAVTAAVFIMLFVSCSVTSAAVKDSDADGLTDSAELQKYFTDPYNPDTDDDSLSDSEEVLQDTNPLVANVPPEQNSKKSNVPFIQDIGQTSTIMIGILLSVAVVSGLSLLIRKRTVLTQPTQSIPVENLPR